MVNSQEVNKKYTWLFVNQTLVSINVPLRVKHNICYTENIFLFGSNISFFKQRSKEENDNEKQNVKVEEAKTQTTICTCTKNLLRKLFKICM